MYIEMSFLNKDYYEVNKLLKLIFYFLIETFKLIYQGNCLNGKMHGYGKLISTLQGFTYIGDFR